MSDLKEIPAEVEAWIGQERYPLESEFDVERAYIFNSCASTENGNPLFWDEKVADETTDGFIAPPSMISVWFRPHFWTPYRTEEGKPMQTHFDLKDALDLPEAIMTDNTIVFGVPVRIGDRLRTHQVINYISDPKTTKLGHGRFWEIEIVYTNQKDELVGKELYTGFGYRRDA
ncbi:MaoC family dehydratase N-terminal domain-containing protein [Myxococcota bacterium]|nr:MaoC family dehydratase N-terminal domain-containing protein [Myxococcota bacterium]